MRNIGFVVATAIAGAVFCSVQAHAQKPVFYPAKQQSAEKQKKDTGECNTWAKQTTGVDPAAPPPAPVAAAGPAVGGGERARGAARGAIVGGAMGDAGAGAAVGAVAGGARARRNQAAQVDSANQQSSSAHAEKMNTYYRAVGACMEGRGYSVK